MINVSLFFWLSLFLSFLLLDLSQSFPMDSKTMHLVLNLHKNTQPCNIGPEILVASIRHVPCSLLENKSSAFYRRPPSVRAQAWLATLEGQAFQGLHRGQGLPRCMGTVFSVGRWIDGCSISQLPDIRSCSVPLSPLLQTVREHPGVSPLANRVQREVLTPSGQKLERWMVRAPASQS